MVRKTRLGVLLLAALAQGACEDGGRTTPAPIVILSPGSGEVFAVGAEVHISWELRQEITEVRIELSRDGRLSWETLSADADAGAGSYVWTATGPISAKCHLRISDAGDESKYAMTGYSFEIMQPFLSVVSPNGNEEWGIGSIREIRWSELGVSHVKIDLSRDGGITWQPITGAEYLDTGQGSYTWSVAGPADVECMVRISDADGGPLNDTSNGLFEIAVPELTLLSPTGGGSWQIQDSMVVSWTAIGVDEVRIDISRDNGITWEAISYPTSAHTGSLTWRVAPGGQGVPQSDCRVRIVNTADETLFDTSGRFTIVWDGVYRAKASAPAGGDGTTWQTAFQHPDEAMLYTSSGDEVWVAAGSYGLRTGDTVLNMDSYVDIYGGFSGSEYDFDLRRPDMVETKLDGGDAAYHVVRGATGASLDGFLITGGNAQGPFEAERSGAGIYNYSVSSMTVVNCTIESNTAALYGGGMYCYSSSVNVTDCVFRYNTAAQGGGAACRSSFSMAIADFRKCTFEYNSATTTSYGDGGGALLYEYAGGRAENCVFWQNTAYCGGGILVYNWDEDFVMIMNCTLCGNHGTSRGGGIDCYYGTYLSVTNSIVWGNSGGIYYSSFYPPTVSYSCLQNLVPGLYNVASDPMFVDQSNGNLHLRVGSPCINAGTDVGAPSEDIEGTSRPRGGGYDMGAYEY